MAEEFAGLTFRMNRKNFRPISLLLLGITFLMLSCAPKVYLSINQNGKTYPYVAPEDVEIYRTARPSFKYERRGYLSFKSSNDDLTYIYNKIREACAEQGINSVIDFNVEIISEPSADGKSETRFFTASGTLVSAE